MFPGLGTTSLCDFFSFPYTSTVNYFSVIVIVKAGRAAPPAAADLAAAATRMTKATATPAASAVAVAQAAAAAVAGTTGGQRRGTKRLVLGETTARLQRRHRGDERLTWDALNHLELFSTSNSKGNNRP